MIRSKQQEFGEIPGGIPDTSNSVYLRGKLQERTGAVHSHHNASFDKRGNDVWAERSGRSYFSDGSAISGGSMDYASPVSGSGMGNLSRLTGGKAADSKRTLPREIATGLYKMGMEAAQTKKGGSALEVVNLMARGAERNRGNTSKPVTGQGKRAPNARAKLVGKIMRERGVSLPEASKIVKAEGLY